MHGMSSLLVQLSDVCMVQEVFNFVGSLEQVKGEFSLASSFPRRVFAEDAMDQSLSELHLAPQAMLFVQNEEEQDA